MSASIPGPRELPPSRYDLSTYWGRVRQSADISDPSLCERAWTLFVSGAGLDEAKRTIEAYKRGQVERLTTEVWKAKKIVDSTLHPDTGQPVFLPFRMSCFVLSNLVVTAGMLTPGLSTTGVVLWQIANQSLNVAINNANANKSSPLSTSTIVKSYCLAVSASCAVALGLNAAVPRLRVSPGTKLILGRLVPFAAVASAAALNVFLMRGEEIRRGIDVFPVLSDEEKRQKEKDGSSPTQVQSLGRSKRAATIAVGETALSRVINATPVMVIPALALVRLQRTKWLSSRPRMTLPVNLGLIFTTSIFALPLALGAFPQRQAISTRSIESEFWDRGGKGGMVEFNRGI